MKQLDEFLGVCDEVSALAREILVKKNHDYAADDDIFRNINTQAELVKLLRLDLTRPTHLALFGVLEKVHRLINLESKDCVRNEPALDSVVDGINFFLLYYGIWKQ